MDRTEDAARCRTSVVGTCLFPKPLLSNGSCIFAYLAVVAQQRVCMLQYYLLHPSVILIFLGPRILPNAVHSSHIPLIYFFLLKVKTKFHTYIKYGELYFCIFES
jgi:hypothetical protein